MDKNDNLLICRAIMRIYTFLKFDAGSNKFVFDNEDKNEASSEYFKIEHQLKEAFADFKIDMYPVPVTTSCGNEIATVTEMFFIYNDEHLEIPNNILDNLKKDLTCNGKTVNTYENQQLFWAYTGRIFDVKNKQKYITDGLQCPGKVIIDLFTYSHPQVTCDALHHRLVHELLHSLGVSEEEMTKYIKSALFSSYDIASEFVETAFQKTNSIKDKFMKSLELLNQKENNLVTTTLKLSNEICGNRFSDPLNKVSLTTTCLPKQLYPTIQDADVQEYNILFM